MGSFIIFGANEEQRLQEVRKRTEKLSSGVDLVVLEEAKGIDSVRELVAALSRKPYQSKAVSVVITEADKLTIEAQNALLKTLEEPPGNANLFLISENPESLLPTVRSRCQLVSLGPIETNVSPRALKSAWQLLERGDLSQIFETSADADPATWAELGRQLLLYIMGGKELLEKLTPGPQLTEFATKEELSRAAERLNSASLQKFLASAQQAKADLERNVNRKLVLENLFLTLPLNS
jgi:DNA polymerase III gamma/tau subunit